MSLVVSRTPFRMSFFGGGTDYPQWYLEEGGEVLSTAIDKYCYISARFRPEFFPSIHRIVWTHIELVQNISDILHPAVREGLKMLDFDDLKGIEIIHQGDLPARTGMGSSSAFAVGLLSALHKLQGRHLNEKELYLQAIELEQDYLKDSVGSQDQVAVAVGGFNNIKFKTTGDISVVPVHASKQRLSELDNQLMLFYTGTARASSEISADIILNMSEKAIVLREMKYLVQEAKSILETPSTPLNEFGQLLDVTWKMKKQLSAKITNPRINNIYDIAKRAGALGGKLLGAGHSGFILLYVPLARQNNVRLVLKDLMEVPFSFEKRGTCILNDNDWLYGSNKNKKVG